MARLLACLRRRTLDGRENKVVLVDVNPHEPVRDAGRELLSGYVPGPDVGCTDAGEKRSWSGANPPKANAVLFTPRPSYKGYHARRAQVIRRTGAHRDAPGSNGRTSGSDVALRETHGGQVAVRAPEFKF